MRTKRGFTQVRGHCVENSSKKDQIYPEELEKIAEEYFGKLKGSPRNDDLNYPQGNKFDHLIRGWTKYWNEVLKPSESLDPDLVKALIATESSFKITEENYAGKKSRSSKGFNASYRLDHRNTER
ncbi:MAG: hypothetical protein HYY61_00380 [Deltaproteobacteria bacterium]|nr:hypothetical protein [Deltaproteobacteria bacterium]